jgi:hypothetical protein
MRNFRGTAFILACALLPVGGQTVIRPCFQAMPDAKINAIPTYVLPDIYKNRIDHPLPRAVNRETDPVYGAYMPPLHWFIETFACANASAVSFDYDYAVQSYQKMVTVNPTDPLTKPFFPYNYTFHFLNPTNMSSTGDGWMFVEAFDILKETGCPTTADFGLFDEDSRYRWMSGYDKYYRAMKIKVDQYYKIDAGSASADTLIKQIVYDYGDGSPGGALLTFQANSSAMPTATINGRLTLTALGGGGGHALTICGYDDTFQGGSWLVQTSWGDGDYWCPYRLLRSTTAWYNNPVNNKYVMFCRLRKNYSPQFTFKITLTHSKRNQICIMTGVANSATAIAPTKTKDYAGAFNYAGGPAPIGGLGITAPIEIGLDLTDFAPDVSAGQGAFFLKVISKGGTGAIQSLALMDYTGAAVREIACNEWNKAISGTVLMTVPWIAANASIGDHTIEPPRRAAGLTASYRRGPATVRFQFPSAGMRAAELRVTDARGKTVFFKTYTEINPAHDMAATWGLHNDRGEKVCPGIYLATVALLGNNGVTHRLNAGFVVPG